MADTIIDTSKKDLSNNLQENDLKDNFQFEVMEGGKKETRNRQGKSSLSTEPAAKDFGNAVNLSGKKVSSSGSPVSSVSTSSTSSLNSKPFSDSGSASSSISSSPLSPPSPLSPLSPSSPLSPPSPSSPSSPSSPPSPNYGHSLDYPNISQNIPTSSKFEPNKSIHKPKLTSFPQLDEQKGSSINNIKNKFRNYQRHILFLVILLLVLCGLWFVWVKKEKNILIWLHFHRHPVVVSQPSSTSSSASSFSQIIPVKSVDIDLLSLADLGQVVRKIESQFNPGQVIILRVKNEKGQDVNFSLLSKALGIKLPETILSSLEENYNFLIYLPDGREKVSCQQSLINQPECFGARIGLVIKIKDGKIDSVKNELNREKMDNLADDWSPLFLFSPLNHSTSSETIYHNVKARYINLPISTMTLDYAIIDNYLVVVTSKNFLYQVVDLLTGTESTK